MTTATDFGDVDPEDAWDDGDPVVDRLHLLAYVLVSIYIEAHTNPTRAAARKLALRAAVARLFDEVDGQLVT